MTLKLEYKRGDSNFAQSFFLNQNGVPFDLSLITGILSVVWNFLENSPNAVKKTISFSGGIQGVNKNKVTFVIPAPVAGIPFFNIATEYNCDIEVYNDSNLILHTNPSFIVQINEVAGLHI